MPLGDKGNSRDRRDQAIREVGRSHAECAAVIVRLQMFRDMFRDERDEWIVKALDTARTPSERLEIKRELCVVLGVTPQWLNRLLKGDAYRKGSD